MPQAAETPNFLFLYTDDQRWDALGVVQRERGDEARFPWFATPHLDRLASEGVRFRNAFVVSSLCSPSRACFLTGQYNHRNGVANNHSPFPENSVTHATLLRAAGYTTGYIGKWHMGSQRERPGFDFAASFVGQGRYNDCPFVVNGKETPTTGWVDDVSTEYAIAFLKENRAKKFSLVVGYKSSHGPWQPPERAKNRFTGAVSRSAPNLNVAPAYRPENASRPAPANRNRNRANNPMSDRSGMQRNYFRTLSAIDDNVGRLLQTLDELGLTENTVVVYSSDNGYYLGEHQLGDKRSAYEESLRVPFLVRYPKGMRQTKGRTEDDMVLNIDLAPTLLDFAGVAIPKEMQGRSLRPHLSGARPRPREAFFYEYFYERGYTIPTVLAVRTPDAKLIKYPGKDEWTELFDIKADPYETRNLYDDPAHRPLRERMLAEFERQAKSVEYRVPVYADKPESAPETVSGPVSRSSDW
jgi:arylsulfatase A-like enzyme